LHAVLDPGLQGLEGGAVGGEQGAQAAGEVVAEAVDVVAADEAVLAVQGPLAGVGDQRGVGVGVQGDRQQCVEGAVYYSSGSSFCDGF
jgi:hypothetical protein